jgi:nucleoside phosphorylase
METIGLIAAMTSESDTLLRCIRRWKRVKIGPFSGARFQLADRDCLMLTSGMGLKRAADAARILLAEAAPQLVVSFGIAGAVNANLEIGDVVLADKTCLFDKGQPGEFLSLAALSPTAWEAAERAANLAGMRLLHGTAITTRGAQVDPQRLAGMINPVLEMETVGIAQTAAGAGVPLLSMRAISDGPRAPIPFDLEAMMAMSITSASAGCSRRFCGIPGSSFNPGR